MKHVKISAVIAFIALTLFSLPTQAQCNAYIKKKCLPNLQPFTHNGQMSTTTVTAGQSAEVNLTFYSGQDYRIYICSQEILGECSFKVMDQNRKVVFDSENHSNPDFWDFKVKSSQQFIVEVKTPVSESTNSIIPSGCVTILVGFKKD
ncbi:MAG: hypothetical protein JNL69_01765 [Bacteroidia bacterium]|nr:hypothetical protein [Bacteroidia bacterium]